MIQRWLACCVLLFVPACLTSKQPETWIEATVEAPSDTILWDVTRMALQKSDFPIGTGLERSKLTAISGWQISLAPFKSDGFRERAYILYVPQGGRAYGVKVRVERETNEDIMHPLDLSYAEWKSSPDNTTRAKILLQYIQSTLGPNKANTSTLGPGKSK